VIFRVRSKTPEERFILPLKPASLQRLPDGGLKSLDYGDIYFQRKESRGESDYVFLRQNNLRERFSALAPDGVFTIGELGFGTGLNVLQAVRLFCSAAPAQARLTIASVEKHPLRYEDLKEIYTSWQDLSPHTDDILLQYPPLVEGFHHLHLAGGRVRLTLLFGDVADVLPQWRGLVDAWFLDGFSPAKNPDMWSGEIFKRMAERTAQGGTLATFSSAGHVRQGLADAGFGVEKVDGYGVKRDMTVGRKGAVAVAGSEANRRAVAPKTISIIGAGIAGCAMAYALAMRGCDVTVYDRHPEAAQEGSGNPVGIIYPKLTVDTSPMGEYYKHAFCYTRNLLEFLRLPSWKPCGVVRLDLNEDDRARSQKLIVRQEPPSDLARDVRDTAFGASALIHDLAGYLDPRAFCRKLLDHPRIKSVFGQEVTDWKALAADITIIAQANASKMFAETAFLPLAPLRGQVTYLKPTAQSGNLSKVICHKGYIAPVVDGLHVAGATFHKEAQTAPDVRPQDHAENLAVLSKNLPGFGFSMGDVTGGRTAWRATTPDKLPIAGKISEGLYVLTGLGAHGLTGAPLMADIIAADIAGDPCLVPENLLRYFLPQRFF
jgi:tRNA 5-methylaminomethyl-2-thiouridine biosynthesis bifunctional protein